MDENGLGSFSRGLPTPEELFHADEWKEQEPERQRRAAEAQNEVPPWDKKKPSGCNEAGKQDGGDGNRRGDGAQGELRRQEKAGSIQAQEEADNGQEQAPAEEPASKRKRSKLFSAGFIIGVLVLALIITNLSFFHIHLFCMMSESMGEAIPKGSIIISYEAPAEKLETGDVITYTNPDGVLITHEIVSVISNYDGNGSYAFRTKGTANESEDEEAVTYGMVEGKALFYIPYVGKPFVK